MPGGQHHLLPTASAAASAVFVARGQNHMLSTASAIFVARGQQLLSQASALFIARGQHHLLSQASTVFIARVNVIHTLHHQGHEQKLRSVHQQERSIFSSVRHFNDGHHHRHHHQSSSSGSFVTGANILRHLYRRSSSPRIFSKRTLSL